MIPKEDLSRSRLEQAVSPSDTGEACDDFQEAFLVETARLSDVASP